MRAKSANSKNFRKHGAFEMDKQQENLEEIIQLRTEKSKVENNLRNIIVNIENHERSYFRLVKYMNH